MAINRTIRLKEWGVFEDTFKTPTDEYISQTDGTLDQKPFHIETDFQGYLKTGNSIDNPGAKRKIVMLGGSFVESLFIEETNRFASRLERQLNENDLPFVVLNAGYSGGTLLHMYNVLLNKVVPILRYTEKVLIFTSMSDNRPQVDRDSYWLKHKLHAPILDPRNPSKHTPEVAPNPRPQRALLSSMIYLCRQFDQEPIVVLSPHRYAERGKDLLLDGLFPDDNSHKRYHDLYLNINNTAREVASDMGISLIDVAAHFDMKPEFFYDTLHLNEAGQAEMASLLYASLANHLQ